MDNFEEIMKCDSPWILQTIVVDKVFQQRLMVWSHDKNPTNLLYARFKGVNQTKTCVS